MEHGRVASGLAVRITFHEQGGVGYFPGLQVPITLDVSALADTDAADLARLIAALTVDVGASTPVADGRRYTIVIDDGTTTRHIEAADPFTDPAVRALVMFLRKQARIEQRRRAGTNDTQPSTDT